MVEKIAKIGLPFEGDWETFEYLKQFGFIHNKGCMYSPPNLWWTDRIHAALDYLIGEWDWAYEGDIPPQPKG